MPYGRRSQNKGPWHYCSRCTRKMKLETELEWQRGKLLCKQYCLDREGPSIEGPGLLGQREVDIAAVLGDGAPELAPPPKLRDPSYQNPDDDILI
jgi:hypothetical protein